MYRLPVIVLVAAFALVGCAQPQRPMEPPQKPDAAPEMAKLERLIGTWSDTAEMVEPSPEEMKKQVPEGSEEVPSSFKGGWKSQWVLRGMFLRNEGWHEMGPDQRMNMVEYYTWDPKSKKYRVWFFSDWGEHGEGWMTIDPDGKTFRIKAKGADAQGASGRSEGTMTFVDDDTLEWTWAESGAHGKMKFKGTSKRQP